jgi:hypothetical protein
MVIQKKYQFIYQFIGFVFELQIDIYIIYEMKKDR